MYCRVRAANELGAGNGEGKGREDSVCCADFKSRKIQIMHNKSREYYKREASVCYEDFKSREYSNSVFIYWTGIIPTDAQKLVQPRILFLYNTPIYSYTELYSLMLELRKWQRQKD